MSYHNIRFITPSVIRYTLVAALVSLPGCDDGGQADGGQPAVSSSVEEREHVADLAWRYLQEEVDEEGARRIRHEIEALSPTQMRLMNKELQLLGDADPRQAQFGDRLTELAIERGVPMFTASQEDIDRIVAEIGESVTPRALCETWKPQSTTSLKFFESAAAGVTPSLYDRRSTGWFEWGGCDHRFYFPGWRTQIDGKSVAYDNWIKSYPAITGQHTGLGTYAVMGNYRAESAGINSVSKSMVKAY